MYCRLTTLWEAVTMEMPHVSIINNSRCWVKKHHLGSNWRFYVQHHSMRPQQETHNHPAAEQAATWRLDRFQNQYRKEKWLQPGGDVRPDGRILVWKVGDGSMSECVVKHRMCVCVCVGPKHFPTHCKEATTERCCWTGIRSSLCGLLYKRWKTSIKRPLIGLAGKRETHKKVQTSEVYEWWTSGFKHLPAPVGQLLNHFSTTKTPQMSDSGAVTTATRKLIRSVSRSGNKLLYVQICSNTFPAAAIELQWTDVMGFLGPKINLITTN